jgi:hypothetical protein
VYQPRGAFVDDRAVDMTAHEDQRGALLVHANSNVRLQELDSPLYVKMVALVE